MTRYQNLLREYSYNGIYTVKALQLTYQTYDAISEWLLENDCLDWADNKSWEIHFVSDSSDDNPVAASLGQWITHDGFSGFVSVGDDYFRSHYHAIRIA